MVKSRTRRSAVEWRSGENGCFCELTGVMVGVLLAIHGSGRCIVQAVVLSIGLTLAVGPNVELLCKTWCPQAAAASECHHKSSSPTPNVAGDKNCDNVVAAAIAVLRDDVRRGVSSQDANQAIPVPRYQLAQLTIDARRGQEPWWESSLERRPLSTALRI